MTNTPDNTSFWTRMMRRLELWATVLDTDVHELTAIRIDALEKRLAVVEAELRIARPANGDPT